MGIRASLGQAVAQAAAFRKTPALAPDHNTTGRVIAQPRASQTQPVRNQYVLDSFVRVRPFEPILQPSIVAMTPQPNPDAEIQSLPTARSGSSHRKGTDQSPRSSASPLTAPSREFAGGRQSSSNPGLVTSSGISDANTDVSRFVALSRPSQPGASTSTASHDANAVLKASSGKQTSLIPDLLREKDLKKVSFVRNAWEKASKELSPPNLRPKMVLLHHMPWRTDAILYQGSLKAWYNSIRREARKTDTQTVSGNVFFKVWRERQLSACAFHRQSLVLVPPSSPRHPSIGGNDRLDRVDELATVSLQHAFLFSVSPPHIHMQAHSGSRIET